MSLYLRFLGLEREYALAFTRMKTNENTAACQQELKGLSWGERGAAPRAYQVQPSDIMLVVANRPQYCIPYSSIHIPMSNTTDAAAVVSRAITWVGDLTDQQRARIPMFVPLAKRLMLTSCLRATFSSQRSSPSSRRTNRVHPIMLRTYRPGTRGSPTSLEKLDGLSTTLRKDLLVDPKSR